ncbi:MAG: sodium:calcium antiporter [Micavibrio sp.]|nr:MAG: sodium:calcium antiporter [Micavibrio sp.]
MGTADTKKQAPNAARKAWEKTRATAGQTARFMRDDPLQPAGLFTAVLLGTTALATPVLATTAGAAALAVGSIWLLTKSSDIVVNNASALGGKIGIAPLVLGIGLGLVTSLPELAVSIGSLMTGVPDLALGNILGSNIANTFLVLGAAAAIKPMNAKGVSWKFNTAVMCGTTALFAGQMALGALNPVMGGAMLAGLGLYMWGAVRAGRKDKKAGIVVEDDEDSEAERKMPKWFNAMWGIAGIAGLAASAGLLVKSASLTAVGLGVSPALVGLLGVAIGTSLPELSVSVKAALKGKGDMALGNILGSNIFNVLMVGGAVAVTGAAVPLAFGLGSAMGILNIAAFTGAAAFSAAAMFMNKKKGTLKRWQGIAALGIYAAFTAASIAVDPARQEAPPPQKAETAVEQSISAEKPSVLQKIPPFKGNR